MLEKQFWGENGEYGPFSQGEDGWPASGEVMRHYRRALNMSAEELAVQYSEAFGEQITVRWILKMEQENKVPTDITRRRVIAKILNIPPILLGIASLDQILYKPKVEIPNSVAHISTTLTYRSLDIEWYNNEARVFWKLHYAQDAHGTLPNCLDYVDNLASFRQISKGSLEVHLCELMNSYYRLASTLERDCGNFAEAYNYANESVRLARAMGNSPSVLQIVAASQYTRGVANLAWGAFGDQVKQGKVSLHREKIQAALTDFEQALWYASPELKGIIYSEMARAKALTSISPTDVIIALRLIEQAEHFVNEGSVGDFYTQILVNGDMKGLDKRRLILGRAKTFLAIKRPARVIEELDRLETLKEGSTHTRRRAWTSILYAQASFDLGDYITATDEAIKAFNDSEEVHAIAHLARIRELHARLQTSSDRESTKVKRLGKLLDMTFPKEP